MTAVKIRVHPGDLPEGLSLGPVVAVDTETMGLNPHRDRLCVVQLYDGEGEVHLVQLAREGEGGAPLPPGSAPRLSALLSDSETLKIFHFARFDLAALRRNLGVVCSPVWCTKIASKLARTYTDRHGLKDLCEELLGVRLNKQQQTSDWGAEKLTDAQRSYAAGDVLHLHRLREALAVMLEREGRDELARACFDFLPVRAELDLLGWGEEGGDLFRH